jgi:hypothetical protein
MAKPVKLIIDRVERVTAPPHCRSYFVQALRLVNPDTGQDVVQPWFIGRGKLAEACAYAKRNNLKFIDERSCPMANLKCYRVWFADGSAILRDAEDGLALRDAVEKEYGQRVTRVTCLSDPPSVRSITVIARRWFQRLYGNTYHSCLVLVDGVELDSVDFTYGYGEHYLQTAVELLNKHNIPATYPLSRYCRENGIAYTPSVTDVQRKKDL